MSSVVLGVAADHEMVVQLALLGIRMQLVEGDLSRVAADNPATTIQEAQTIQNGDCLLRDRPQVGVLAVCSIAAGLR